MKKKTAHKKTSRTAGYRIKKNTYKRGALGAGTAYALLGLLILMSAGAMMVGSIFPRSQSPQAGQTVIIATNTPAPRKSNLQLYTFPGATYTPTPSPTPVPQPQQSNDSGSGGGNHDSGGSGGGSCFPAGTKIAMANGSQKNIEDVKVGEKVMGFDGQKQVVETVLQTEHPLRNGLYQVTFGSGLVLRLTAEHPLLTVNGWESLAPNESKKEDPNLIIGFLHVGDEVLNNRNQFDAVTAITYLPGKVQTYNLKTVTGFDNYYAGEITDNGFIAVVAHNKGSCFIAGTKILMENGLEKDIQDVVVGDKVMGYNTSLHKITLETVEAVESPIRDHYYRMTLSDGTVLGLTREHPLYTTEGWESIDPKSTLEENPKLVVGQLKLGDSILKDSGEYAEVVSLVYIPGTIQTYNLKRVSGYNDFFANGFLAHNKGSGGGGGSSSGGGGGSSGSSAM